MKQPGILAVAVAGLMATPAAAQVKISSTPILQSGATVGGASIAYPKTDSAELTAVRLDIGPGGETGRDMHPYPTRSDEQTSDLQPRLHLVCRLLRAKKKKEQSHRHRLTTHTA